ncbi:hypothetical protein R3P38DRAFT_3554115 [Favolaschia claudopus]|uniref:Uncharacterized protein n=1 Tax=Favolaschia claudopus TaxID=2862362 RepID=A0AAW0B0X4_9AGAR
MVLPLPLGLVAAIAVAWLPVFQMHARAALVNLTIEDFDPEVDANFCDLSHCDATANEENPCDQTGFNHQTFSIVKPVQDIGLSSPPCSVRVPFNGIAIYAFVSCSDGCDVSLDNTRLPLAINLTGLVNGFPLEGINPANGLPLGYFDDSLSNQPHTLIISSLGSLLVDKFVYTIDDGNPNSSPIMESGKSTSTVASVAGTSSISPSLTSNVMGSTSTASTSPSSFLSTPPSPSPRRSTPNIAVILGGALGGLILIAVIIVTVVWCRRLRLRTGEHSTDFVQPALPPAMRTTAEYQSTTRRKTPWLPALPIFASHNRHVHSSPPHRLPEGRDEAQGEDRDGVAASMHGRNDSPPPEYFA